MFKTQNGGRSPCWKILETPQLAYRWIDWDETWEVSSMILGTRLYKGHRVHRSSHPYTRKH